MITERLKAKEREIRTAVERRQYDGIPERLEELRRAAGLLLGELPDPEQRREVIRWLLALVDWSRLMIVTQRQAIAEDLEGLPRLTRYLGQSNCPDEDKTEVCVDL